MKLNVIKIKPKEYLNEIKLYFKVIINNLQKFDT